MGVIDTSAVAAIMLDEPDRLPLLREIHEAGSSISVVNVFELAMVLSKKFGGAASALIEVQRFLAVARIAIEGVDTSLLAGLALAHERYGKGTGHPARLNMGDCFAYATAKSLGLPLIYKGNDFAQTDLA